MILLSVIVISLIPISKTLTLQNGYSTSQSDVTSAESDIANLINDNAANNAKTVLVTGDVTDVLIILFPIMLG